MLTGDDVHVVRWLLDQQVVQEQLKHRYNCRSE